MLTKSDVHTSRNLSPICIYDQIDSDLRLYCIQVSHYYEPRRARTHSVIGPCFKPAGHLLLYSHAPVEEQSTTEDKAIAELGTHGFQGRLVVGDFGIELPNDAPPRNICGSTSSLPMFRMASFIVTRIHCFLVSGIRSEAWLMHS